MSVVLIKDHDESIYRANKKSVAYHKKELRYISKHRENFDGDFKNVKRYSHATMGLPERSFPNVADFLRKKCGIRHKVEVNSTKVSQNKQLKSSKSSSNLVKTKKEYLEQLPTEKNFVFINIKKAVSLNPKVPEERTVIHPSGTSKKMSAGMEPIYIYKTTFGKIPVYLKQFVTEKEKKLLMKKDVIGTEQPKCRYITKNQREELLAGLKENWEEMQKTYQGLPILTDTIPKMQRKSKLENDLKQLEKDIVILERHSYIYVYDDNDLSNYYQH